MRLAEFQERLQNAILFGKTDFIEAIDETPGFDRAARIGVYFDAYRLRLAEFISKEYPILREAIGDDEFEALAIAYMDQTRSRHSNARWYASKLPKFMSGHPQWRMRDDWIDLARFERALSDAFDAADAPASGVGALSTIEQESVPQLRFEFHPSVHLLDLRTGTENAYAAATEGTQISVSKTGREHVLVWRRSEQCCYRRLEDDETLALTEALNGRRFGEICSLLAFRDMKEDVTKRVAGLLLQWFDDEIVSAITFGE